MRARTGVLVAVAIVPLLLAARLAPAPGEREELFEQAFETILEEDLLSDLELLAGPETEGRDSPSHGLEIAARHVAARLQRAGFSGLGAGGSLLLPFKHGVPAPDAGGCQLVKLGTTAEPDDRRGRGRRGRTDDEPAEPAGDPVHFELGVDFVPVDQAEGEARGEVVLLGFGIDSKEHRFDEVTGDLDGHVGLIVAGEPEHKRRFDGPEISEASEIYAKLESLEKAGMVGALVVRRPPAGVQTEGEEAESNEAPVLPFRHSWARWSDGMPLAAPPRRTIPSLEITPAVARQLTGIDVLEHVRDVARSLRPAKPLFTGVSVEIGSAVKKQPVEIHNVVAELEGSDPELSEEYVVIGAHYDHVGVDSRGRVGHGADDNASGTAALLELAEAFAVARPRRSILICAFAAEEDGLVGSTEFVKSSPIDVGQMVAMINLDMIGYGDPKEVAVIGVPENPSFEGLLKRARKLKPTAVTRVTTGQGQEVFKRSDHYPFHREGIPVLFFFEGLPVGANPHYHMWTDTLEHLDLQKVARITRLVFNTAWLLSEDDERPPPPEHTR